MSWLEIGVKARSPKLIGTDIYDFVLTFHSNHGPISHSFRNRRQFQSKIATTKNPPRVFFAQLVNPHGRRGRKKTEWWSYQVVQKVLRSRLNTVPACDRQTDGQIC